MRLPIAISVPYAGLSCPSELGWYNALNAEDVYHDHDIGASELFALAESVMSYTWTAIARSYIDVDRAPADFGPDGVFKVHTQWNRLVYRSAPPPEVVGELIEAYHRSYHQRLSDATGHAAIGLDCHTLIHRDHEPALRHVPRTMARIGVMEGACHDDWIHSLHAELASHLACPVLVYRVPANAYTLAAHRHEMPWVRLELQPDFAGLEYQRAALQRALTAWCGRLDGPSRERRNMARWDADSGDANKRRAQVA